jgi:hypothetical protein
MLPRSGQPSTSVCEYGWVACPVKGGPSAPAFGGWRACHPAFVSHQAFDGKERLTPWQASCQLFSLRHLYADSDSHPQQPPLDPTEPIAAFLNLRVHRRIKDMCLNHGSPGMSSNIIPNYMDTKSPPMLPMRFFINGLREIRPATSD